MPSRSLLSDNSRKMFCPECKAEYREGYSRCADCEVDLVLSLPQEPEYSEHDPFAPLWSGGPGQMMAQIRKTLDDARIPFRVIEYKDTLFNVNYRAPYEIAVPPSQLEKAREALGWNIAAKERTARHVSAEEVGKTPLNTSYPKKREPTRPHARCIRISGIPRMPPKVSGRAPIRMA